MLPLLVATIISTSVSNSSTGGNVVQDGSFVNGSSYSSVSVETFDDGGGATSTVHIETDENGRVDQQTITKTAPPGGSIDIHVGTSTGNVKAVVRVGHAGSSTPLFGTTTAFWGASTTPGFMPYFGTFFRHFFDFLRFW